MLQLNNKKEKQNQSNGSEQLSIAELENPQENTVSVYKHRGRYRSISRPPTSPNLFPNGKTNSMASNKLIWEAANILTQGNNLGWTKSGNASPYYESPVAKGQGYVSFWVTEDLHTQHPAILEGEAALALIEQFDIRAACMHLIYAAHATQLERPWEQQFVLSDVQLERYLGLDKNRNIKNKQQKLELLLHLAKQPCQILVYVSWPSKGKVNSFSISRTWLWEIAEPILHYQDCFYDEQENPIGEKQLIGFTLKIRCGNWAQYFLNEEKQGEKSGYYEYGILSSKLLQDLMSIWHHHEGAARLMIWLLFKSRVNQNSVLMVEKLMKVAFGETLIEAAKTSSQERKKLVRRWENTVKVLIEKGWQIKPDIETYPPEYWAELMTTNPLNKIPDDPEIAAKFWAADATQPEGSRITDITKRTRGSFERLLNGRLWIQTPKEIAEKLNNIAQSKKVERSKPVGQKSIKPRSKKTANQPQQNDVPLELTREQVKEIRIAKGLSVTKLAELTGMGKSTISMIETGKRNITDETRKRLREALGII